MTDKANTTTDSGSFWTRHDLTVVAVALVILGVAGFAHRSLAAPGVAHLTRTNLTLTYPSTWIGDLGSTTVPSVAAMNAIGEAGLGMEVRVDKKPSFDGPLESSLDFSRAQRYGQMYQRLGTSTRRIGGKDWLRTEFAYAYKASDGDAPRIAWALEYAMVNNDVMYAVTLHGEHARILELEPSVLGTLSVH